MEEAYASCLKEAAGFYTLHTADEVDSTNARVKDWAAGGAPEGAVLIAERQSAGRGRRGRSFYSPEGTGLYMSILLRPAFAAEHTPLITTAAAVAVCRAIRETGADARIKWVNDVLIGERKVCGILCEGVPGAYAVLGIGVNLCDPAGGFPPELAAAAGSVFGAACTQNERCGLAARILEAFYSIYRALPDAAFMDEYRARNLVPGKRVRVLSEPPYEARAVSILDDGALLVQTDGGETRRIGSGEVSVRPL